MGLKQKKALKKILDYIDNELVEWSQFKSIILKEYDKQTKSNITKRAKKDGRTRP